MSAFMLDTKGFGQLATILVDWASNKNNSKSRPVLNFLFDDYEQAYNADTAEIIKRVELRINNLISANEHAVCDRYGDDMESEYYIYKRVSCNWHLVQVIKNLQCLRYQMSEGSVPETDIYKMLNNLIAGLSTVYVEMSPVYEGMAWGW